MHGQHCKLCKDQNARNITIYYRIAQRSKTFTRTTNILLSICTKCLLAKCYFLFDLNSIVTFVLTFKLVFFKTSQHGVGPIGY